MSLEFELFGSLDVEDSPEAAGDNRSISFLDSAVSFFDESGFDATWLQSIGSIDPSGQSTTGFNHSVSSLLKNTEALLELSVLEPSQAKEAESKAALTPLPASRLNSTYMFEIEIPSDISSIDALDFGSAQGSDIEDVELELDVDQFFSENVKIPVAKDSKADSSIPLNFSTDKARLGQDEDKETTSKTQSITTEKNPAVTPAFKAAIQRKNTVAFFERPMRSAKAAAIEKMSKVKNKM